MKIALAIVIMSLLLFGDLLLAMAGKRPRFSLCLRFYKDGGTRDYLGLFYTVTYYHRMFSHQLADGTREPMRTIGPDYRHKILPIRIRKVRTIKR